MKTALLLSALLLGTTLGTAQGTKAGRFHHGNSNGGAGGYYGNYYSPPVMGQDEFARACEAIRRPGFDDDRFVVATQVARGGMMSSAQVSTVLGLFAFESTRLDFAKFAYAYVVDPSSYYVVNDGLRYSSSVDELGDFLATAGVGAPVGDYPGGGNVGVNSYGGGGTTTYSTGTMTVSGGVSGGPYPGGGNVGINSYGGSCPAPAPMPMAICESEFERIHYTVSKKCFDSDRLMVAKQATAGRFINTGMVLRIMRLFSFESSRLDFAKFAYGLTVDRQNYYLVNDGFVFSSSSRELDCYIRGFH